LRLSNVAARLRVELDAITKNRVLNSVKGYECALDKLAIAEEDTHTHNREAREMWRR
jgi:hypothetical protein